MKVSIFYDSVTGNTKKLADVINESFNNVTTIEESDIVFIGSWTDKGNPSLKVQEELKKIKNKKIFYFGTCGFGGSKQYYEMLFDRVKAFIDSSNQIIGYFYCQGKMPKSIKDRYENLLKENPNDEKIKRAIENFDNALNHPNEDDLNSLKKILEEIKEKY